MLWTGVEGSPSQRPFLLSFSLLSGFTLLGQYHKYTWSFKRKSLVGYVYHSHAGYSLSVSGKTQNQGFRGRLFWVGQNTQPPTQCINSISCCRKKAVSLCLNSFFFKKSSLNLLHCCFWVFFFFNVLVFWLWDMWDLRSLNQGWNLYSLHWRVKSQPLDHQGKFLFEHFL